MAALTDAQYCRKTVEALVFGLDNPYPQPATDTINFAFTLPEDGRVVLSIYDLSGRRVAKLVDSELMAGRHDVAWNCGEIPSGVYLYRLEASEEALIKRLVINR